MSRKFVKILFRHTQFNHYLESKELCERYLVEQTIFLLGSTSAEFCKPNSFKQEIGKEGF